MSKPYRADTDRANRLHAARRAAGFKSARDAAIAFGWPPKTYQAHETANLQIEKSVGKVYAAAFKVPADWLYQGRGKGPAVDEARQARFNIRQRKAKPLEDDAAGRLRAARRLAGYRSVTSVAEATGINRTTVSAHEAGQNQIPREAALRYARAYAVEPDWLLAGKSPSGLPPEANAALNQVIAMHRNPDSKVFTSFAHLILPARPGFRRPEPVEKDRMDVAASTPDAQGEVVPEFSAHAFYLHLAGQAGGTPSASWVFPAGYLSRIYGCERGMAAFVTVPQGSPGLRDGTRLLINTGVTDGMAKRIIVTNEGRLHLFEPAAHIGELLDIPPHQKLAGAVVAYFGPLPQ